jgi:hypothetical protein
MDANFNPPPQNDNQVQSRSDNAERRVQQQQVDPSLSFATVLSNNGRSAMNALGRTPKVPSAHVLAAAVMSVKSFKQRASGQTATAPDGASIGIPLTTTPVDTTPAATSTTASTSPTDPLSGSTDSNQILLQQTQQMQELNNSFNLQYLQLQENMQQDNRAWTTVSNVAKTRHDTAKNSINNLH